MTANIGSAAPSRLSTGLSAALSVAAIGLTLYAIVFGAASPVLYGVILLAYAALNLGGIGIVARIVFTVSCLLGALAAWLPGVSLDVPLRQAGFFFALLVLLQALGSVAARSRDVELAARSIVSRAPSLRYLMLTGGSHVFGLFLSIGSVSLFMSMLSAQLGAAGEGARAMTLAVVRGFVATLYWSPLAIALIIVVSLIEGMTYWTVAPVGFLMTLLYLALGYLFDGRDAGRARGMPDPAAAPGEAPATHGPASAPLHVGPLLRTAARIFTVVAGGLTLSVALHMPLMEAVFVAELVVMLTWLLAQKIAAPAMPSALGVILSSSAIMANELIIVSSATFIGALCTQIFAAMDVRLALSPLVYAGLLAVIPSIIFTGALVAVNALVTVSILAGVLGAAWPETSRIWLAVALLWGWGAATAGTPFNANVLIAAKTVRISGAKLSLGWNRRHTLVWLVLGSVFCPLAGLLAGL